MLAPLVHAGTDPSLCDVVDRATVTSAFGKIIETDVLPETCTFITEFNGGSGMFHVMRYDTPVPESRFASLTTQTGPNDRIVDVPDIGEKAVANLDTKDMVLKVRGRVYMLSTRGMPCGSAKYGLPANQDEEAKCELKRIEVLKRLGREIAR